MQLTCENLYFHKLTIGLFEKTSLKLIVGLLFHFLQSKQVFYYERLGNYFAVKRLNYVMHSLCVVNFCMENEKKYIYDN